MEQSLTGSNHPILSGTTANHISRNQQTAEEPRRRPWRLNIRNESNSCVRGGNCSSKQKVDTNVFPDPPSCPPPPEWIRKQAEAGNPAWISAIFAPLPIKRTRLWKVLKRQILKIKDRMGLEQQKKQQQRSGGDGSPKVLVTKQAPVVVGHYGQIVAPPYSSPKPCSNIYSTGSGMGIIGSEGRVSVAGTYLPRFSGLWGWSNQNNTI
ncbi:uncharacterized protein PpBr36_11112 [Pyricularia pennisetigena]|uniref:uncharacterized protein n=1 Tax=Pyricularia pennisetigena TaxID=1578925 RepID=UPI001154C461|nr:uncharacterized protein PpBr36_11112 [Pyricularia pennisetigena]TLS20607.1 hypothetical protein PpBr36_11112 [Pyricularia pennisetigena]